MKAMKDSLHKVAAGVQAFVVNLREMLRCDRIAYIGGRPRKRAAVDTRQLLLPFPPGNWGKLSQADDAGTDFCGGKAARDPVSGRKRHAEGPTIKNLRQKKVF
jgi:hypothetical protein